MNSHDSEDEGRSETDGVSKYSECEAVGIWALQGRVRPWLGQ
jgi:hypothetical protein